MSIKWLYLKRSHSLDDVEDELALLSRNSAIAEGRARRCGQLRYRYIPSAERSSDEFVLMLLVITVFVYSTTSNL